MAAVDNQEDQAKPTFISLFAGIGGIDLGLERAGFKCVAQVEWDEFCSSILTRHWPSVPKFQDIKDVTSEQLAGLGPVDLVAGGFPCQTVSNAGKQKAQEDERWLWPEFARVIRTVRPRVVFVENVPGLLTAPPAEPGKAFSEVQGDLAALGYDTEWEVIPASAFGAHHLRKRVALVAYAESLADPDSIGRHGRTRLIGQTGRNEPPHGGNALADSDGTGSQWGGLPERQGRQTLPDSNGSSQRIFWRTPRHCEVWATEPDVGRVANGVPRRMDRLKALGNAVVPQFAEYVGLSIMEKFFS